MQQKSRKQGVAGKCSEDRSYRHLRRSSVISPSSGSFLKYCAPRELQMEGLSHDIDMNWIQIIEEFIINEEILMRKPFLNVS